MEFSGQYLTYSEYLCLGGSLHPTPFYLLEFAMRRKIDEITHQRLVGKENIPEQVKICMFNLMEVAKTYQNERSKDISSETVGGHSVTYNDVKQIIENKEEEFNNIILTDLYGVMYNGEHIIYCGV